MVLPDKNLNLDWEEETVHYHHQNKIFWIAFLAFGKNFQADGRYKAV